MDQSGVPRRLKRVKAMLPTAFQRFSGDADNASDVPSQDTGPTSSGTCHRIIRVFLGDPWDDYEYIRHIDQVILARYRSSYFKLVNIRQYSTSNVLEQARIISTIQHPNLATVYNVYCDNEKVFLITENLDISISQLNFQKFDLEEWEIATVIAEVLKGVAYVSSLKLVCRDLMTEDIRLSLNGEIKLLLDLQKLKHDHLHENPRASQVLFDFPILAELIEEMMLSRYHLTSDDERWSKDALDFLSCTLSGSLESLMNHCFLRHAVSPTKLIPRIRFALEALRQSSCGVDG